MSWKIMFCCIKVFSLVSYSPVRETVIVNDRWGNDSRYHHGGVMTDPDHFNPSKSSSYKIFTITFPFLFIRSSVCRVSVI